MKVSGRQTSSSERRRRGLRKPPGCDVIYEPDLKEDALDAGDCLKRRRRPRRAGHEGHAPRCSTPGGLSLDRPRRRRLQHDRRRRPPRSAASTSPTAQARTRSRSRSWHSALLLALDRRIPDNVAELRAGAWNKKEYSKAQGLYGRTLVLLGVGSIGQEMIRRAAGFGMPVVIWSRRFDGQNRPLTDIEAREMGIESVLRSIAIELAPSPAEAARARRHRQRPRGARSRDARGW